MVERDKLEKVAGVIRDCISLSSAEEYMASTCIRSEDFRPLPEEVFQGRTFAVDGSNVVICDWSVAKANHIRAGYVVYRGRKWQRTVFSHDDIFLADKKSYQSAFRAYLRRVFGLDGFRLEETELDRLTTYFRELQEYVALHLAMREAEEGDLILYDGGFALWKDRPFGDVLDWLFEEGERKKVDLLGVSKSSSFSWGQEISRPFVQHTGYIGSQASPSRPWCLDLTGKQIDPDPSRDAWHGRRKPGRIYVVSFHPGANRAFRVDAPDYVTDHILSALSHAALYSGSAESLGYPHALFRAHRDMSIQQEEGRLLRLRLLDALGSLGLEEAEVRGSLDYHEILEMDLWR